MAAAVAKHEVRHVVVTDINPYRLELAKKWATRAVDVSKEDLKDVMNELV